MPEAKASNVDPAGWVEFQISGSLPALEVFADFMAGLGAGGAIFSEDPGAPGSEMATAFLPRLKAGDEVVARVRSEVEALAVEFPEVRGGLKISLVEDQDWAEEWKKSLKPIRVPPGLWIVPSFLETPAEAGEEPALRIDPGLAFGTGHHVTTRQALTAVIEAVKSGAGSVLDLGTGSGILAMAAARFGAGRVVGVDLDPLALAVARENLVANGLVERVELIKGVSDPDLVLPGPPFDYIAANLFAESLAELTPFIRRHLRPGGQAALSGILRDRAPAVEAAYLGSGFIILNRIEEEGWLTLIVKR